MTTHGHHTPVSYAVVLPACTMSPFLQTFPLTHDGPSGNESLFADLYGSGHCLQKVEELNCCAQFRSQYVFSHLDLSSETSVFAHLLAILMGHSESSLIFYWTHGTSPSSNMQYVHDELLSWLHFNDWKYPPFNALQDLNAKHTYKQTFRITNCIISKFFGVIFCSAALLRVELF